MTNSRPSNFIDKLIEATQVTEEKCVKDDKSILKNVDLSKFKINECSMDREHNKLQCPFYHNKDDKRREFSNEFNYSASLCSIHLKKQNCPKKDKCILSINKIESKYHPAKYKKSFCIYFPFKLKECPYSIYCFDAHSEDEIKIDLLHNYLFDYDFFMFKFKTEICPYANKNHNNLSCVYAHSYKDIRRDIMKHPYANYNCEHWDPKNLKFYGEGCKSGINCTLCHGNNEFEYHPLNYKRHKCKNLNNCKFKNKFCPYLHDSEESKFKELDNDPYFYLAPINRIVNHNLVEDNITFPQKSKNIMYDKDVVYNMDDVINDDNSSFNDDNEKSNNDSDSLL